MSGTIVGYGLGGTTRGAAEQAKADAWAKDNGAEVRLWRRDGRSRKDAPVHERSRLLEALFLLRVGLADTLWLPSLSVLGDDPWRVALLIALTEQAGGELIVGGESVDHQAWLPQLTIARAWVAYLTVDHPRPDEWSPPVHGTSRTPDDAGRLARKLHTDLGLRYKEIAPLLNAAGYRSAEGRTYTASNINGWSNRSERDASWDLPAAAGPSVTAMSGWVATFGPDAEALVPVARTSFAEKAGLTPEEVTVLPIQFEQSPDDPASRDRMRRGLPTAIMLIHQLFVSDPTVLWVDHTERSLISAYLDHSGVDLVIGGVVTPIEPAEPAGQDEAARSLVAAYAVLRAHDIGSVIDPELSLGKAREYALRMLAEGLVEKLREVGHTLDVEGFPTRRGTGDWSPSAVAELLGGRE